MSPPHQCLVSAGTTEQEIRDNFNKKLVCQLPAFAEAKYDINFYLSYTVETIHLLLHHKASNSYFGFGAANPNFDIRIIRYSAPDDTEPFSLDLDPEAMTISWGSSYFSGGGFPNYGASPRSVWWFHLQNVVMTKL